MIERIGSHSTTNLDSSAHCALPRVPSLVLVRITNSEMQKGKLVQLDGRHAVDVSELESGTPNRMSTSKMEVFRPIKTVFFSSRPTFSLSI